MISTDDSIFRVKGAEDIVNTLTLAARTIPQLFTRVLTHNFRSNYSCVRLGNERCVATSTKMICGAFDFVPLVILDLVVVSWSRKILLITGKNYASIISESCKPASNCGSIYPR